MDELREKRRCLFRRKVIIAIVAVLAVCLASTFYWLDSHRETFWEETLSGPFVGREYNGPLTDAPVSSLFIASGGTLEVYEIPNARAPAVVMRNVSGNVNWARLLVPETSNTADENREHELTDLRLLSWEARNTDHVVRIACYWDGGGRENGLIYLNERFQFLHFKLGW